MQKQASRTIPSQMETKNDSREPNNHSMSQRIPKYEVKPTTKIKSLNRVKPRQYRPKQHQKHTPPSQEAPSLQQNIPDCQKDNKCQNSPKPDSGYSIQELKVPFQELSRINDGRPSIMTSMLSVCSHNFLTQKDNKGNTIVKVFGDRGITSIRIDSKTHEIRVVDCRLPVLNRLNYYSSLPQLASQGHSELFWTQTAEHTILVDFGGRIRFKHKEACVINITRLR